MTEGTFTDNEHVPESRFTYMLPADAQCRELSLKAKVPYPLAVLLWKRGIRTSEEARIFLDPQLADLPSPFLIKDMDNAVSLVHRAIKENWKLYVHGDYDVDGISGSALLARFFNLLGVDTVCFQPDRLTHGYGLQEQFVRRHAPSGDQTSLLITVDCGISDIKTVELARELGFKVIVTDHHLPGDILPPADALLNPHRLDCAFPYKELAGVGVAFFLVMGIRTDLVKRGVLERKNAPNLKSLLDLVALGTVADVMPVTGINRILVRAGLEIMNQSDCHWAKALCTMSRCNFGMASSEDISFRFAPRINAPGRLGKPDVSFQLLSSDDPERCHELAVLIEQLNQQRRDIEAQSTEQVLVECERQEKAGASAFVVYGEYHQGIIGIIASRVVDRFKKPVIIFSDDQSRKGVLRGSGRSVESINLYNILNTCSSSLLQFGGHAMAAGMALYKADMEAFATEFKAEVAGREIYSVSEQLVHVDYCFAPGDRLDKVFMQFYENMQPFGNSNPEPLFLMEYPEIINPKKVKGHLVYSIRCNGIVYRGIGFGMADKIDHVENGPVRLAFKIKKNVFKGECHTELHAIDLEPAHCK